MSCKPAACTRYFSFPNANINLSHRYPKTQWVFMDVCSRPVRMDYCLEVQHMWKKLVALCCSVVLFRSIIVCVCVCVCFLAWPLLYDIIYKLDVTSAQIIIQTNWLGRLDCSRNDSFGIFPVFCPHIKLLFVLRRTLIIKISGHYVSVSSWVLHFKLNSSVVIAVRFLGSPSCYYCKCLRILGTYYRSAVGIITRR